MSTRTKSKPSVKSKTRKSTKSDRVKERVVEKEVENNEPVLLPSLISQSKSVLNNLKHFAWDLLGTFLALLAVLTLLGLLGLSRGTVMDSWINFLHQSFGFGRFLLVIILVLLSVVVFKHGVGKKIPLSFKRIIAIEGLFIVIFPLLSAIGGVSVDRASDGLDGGVFGWGLAQLFVPFLTKTGTLLLYLVLFLFLAGYVSGVHTWLAGGGFSRFMTRSRHGIDPGLSDLKHKKLAQAKLSQKINNEAEHEAADSANRQQLLPADAGRDDRLPPLTLLTDEQFILPHESLIKEKALVIERKLGEFGVPVKVIGYRVGPTVTQYAVEPGYTERVAPDGIMTRQKVKVSKISSLSRDLALALSAQRLRVETPVPGKSYVGIEVPNEENSFVRLKPILDADVFKSKKAPLIIALGRDVSGEPVTTDLEKLPHLLIAGTTNSGKSVCVTSLTTCLVMNNSPSDLRLVMLDPKMVELVRFNGLPHMMGKVETELERMLAVLRWAQMEMDLRYRLLAEVHARNLAGYNQKMRQKKKPPLPRIVIVIDELADLMMNAPEQTEHSLIRLAQMARATGIHMVVATQRPSTDVVTGLIKANFPARISFAMASSVDSRVILDSNGAENLLGRGDMLFLDPARSGLQRLQGVIVSDGEIENIQKFWQSQPRPIDVHPAPWEEMVEEIGSSDADELVEQAIDVVRAAGKASTSLLQRRLRIGFPRAARLMDELEEMGVIGPAVGSGKEREVLLDPDDGEENSRND